MKIDLMTIYRLGLTPSQLYLLLCISKKQEAKFVNVLCETRLLQTDGFLDLENPEILTVKGYETMAKAEIMSKSKAKANKATLTAKDLEMIGLYRKTFPGGILPSGKAARASVQELSNKFIWFFTMYPEYRQWELIGTATMNYCNYYKEKQYEFMQSSEYFISKTDKTGAVKSELAAYCQMILDGDDE